MFKVLFVNRGQADARQEIREQINARASDVTESSKGSTWRQLFIFPEGTTTNGKTLIKFKTGAFQVNINRNTKVNYGVSYFAYRSA